MHSLVAVAALLAAVAGPAAVHAQNLNKLAKAAGLLYFGTGEDPSDQNDSAYAALENDVNMFGQWTPGNAQKWDTTEASQGSFNFATADATVALAASHGQIMRCHTLVWYSQLPSWVSGGTWTAAQLQSVIETHISNEAGHFKGKCYSWDVVNEALNDDGTYRTSVFYNVLGTNYIPIAFNAAAAADPAAKLYYNDYNLEYNGAKADSAVAIVKLLQAAGSRIDGVGLQAHLIVGSTPAQSSLVTVLNRFTALNVDVAYTELDIRFSSLPSTDAGLAQQATDYKSVVGSCLAVSRCVGVTVWGFGDAHSWIPSTFSGQGDACLYNSAMSAKPAYTAVSTLLASAAPRSTSVGSTTTSTSTTSKTSTTLSTSTTTKVSTTTTKTTTTTTTTATGATQTHWGQCGGSGWTGPTACASPYTCTYSNDWYSQCL